MFTIFYVDFCLLHLSQGELNRRSAHNTVISAGFSHARVYYKSSPFYQNIKNPETTHIRHFRGSCLVSTLSLPQSISRKPS